MLYRLDDMKLWSWQYCIPSNRNAAYCNIAKPQDALVDTIGTVNVTRADGLSSMFECLAKTIYLVWQLTGEMKWDYNSVT